MLGKREMTVLLLAGLCCLGTAFCENQSENPNPPPYENTSVLAEAFLVRVSSAALAENGVNPIGQALGSVSILKILACLQDPEKAEIISGAKAAAMHNNEAQVKNTETFYLKRGIVTVGKQGDVESKAATYDAYTSGKTFKVAVWVHSDEKIGLSASYSDTAIIKNEDQATPHSQLEYDWSGRVVVQSGVPVIVGATQSSDDAVIFLIVRATIQQTDEK